MVVAGPVNERRKTEKEKSDRSRERKKEEGEEKVG